MPPTNLQDRRNQTAHPTLDGISLGLRRLPLPPAPPSYCRQCLWRLRSDGSRRSWRLSHPRVRTHHPFLPRPWRGLGWAGPLAGYPSFSGLAPSPDIPVLGGLPLTSDDFRTHRATIPSPSATIRPRRPRATFPQAPYTAYAINARDDAPRPTRPTRSQTAILDGNTPSRSDYRTAAHNGFAASAAAASPPLRTSPPPRSTRLGSTTSPGRRAPIGLTPPPADL